MTFGPASLHDQRSISKSVVSLLYGIALGEGSVPAPEAPLLAAFPEHSDLAADPARAGLTVHHALAMTMGTEWDEDAPYGEDANSETAMNRAPDSLRFALDRPMVSTPGETWKYNGGATTILAELIERGTGMALTDFAREALFAPLGIERFEWTTDYYGKPYAHSGLRLAPRDAAKLGVLVLQDGRWNGEQVVPADWIAASTARQAEAGYGCGYGYQWWLCTTDTGHATVEGSGWGGQILLIQRDLGIVLMVNAGLYGDPDAWMRAYALFDEVVVPALEPETASRP